jgi:hypothetical protein
MSTALLEAIVVIGAAACALAYALAGGNGLRVATIVLRVATIVLNVLAIVVGVVLAVHAGL